MNFDIQSLVIDRTKADVDAGNQKGAYNASDLSRVGEAVAYLAGVLNGYGYAVAVSPKTDWTAQDTPTEAQMQRYLDDVAALRAALAVMETTPEVPADMAKLTYAEANDIEQILKDIDAAIQRITRTVDLGWALGTAHIGLYGGIT